MQLPRPDFSIIIPTYNRLARLQQCLQSIAHLDYPKDRFEVIVVDDGSATPLDGAIAPFQQQITLTLITQPNAGPATARNTGAAAARGEILAFTDDDCQPAAHWLTALKASFSQDGGAAVGGHTHNALTDNIYAAASQALVDYLYQHYNAVAGDARFITSNNLAVPTDAFRAMNGFDETFPLAAAEDRDFCERWRGAGHRIVYVPEAVVYHRHQLTLRSFWQQQFNYGRGAYHFYQQTPGAEPPQQKRQAWTFYLRLLQYPLTHTSWARVVPVVMLFGLSQIAVVTGLLFESIQRQGLKQSKIAA